ncbi:putative Auxin-induced protein 5NG4 [Corchorus olitorius]|uniref:Auxin-induced protein 5NG4 n=1 Tax=Corchorus olitorius TaxID=93759 RepID=A0A1R3JQ23_9ROSI|nr:putative Auxin-induced protein 5NG4 [Corchorus olitorius]
MESLPQLFNSSKPFLAVILMQFSYAVMSIIAKFALNHGLSPHVLVAYRMAVASALISPFAIVLERPVLDHNCFYTGMKYTTATFSTAMCNILPTLTFVLACIFKLEKVELRKVQSQAKVVGTLVTVGGAMMMTFIKGTTLHPPWTKGRNHRGQSMTGGAHQEDLLKGTLLLIAGCCCWSFFIISQAVIIKSYPAKLSLTALICTMGAVEGAILALAVERNDTSVWQIHLDSKLIAVLYGVRTSFKVIGSIVIVIGLYLVLWGKSKDQPKSKPDAGTVEHSDQQMAAIENTETPPDLVSITIEANRVRPIKESDRIDIK